MEEGHELPGEKNGRDIRHLVTALWKLGPAAVVVTDGAEGAYAFDGGEVWHVPAFPATVKERTGAGDSLASGVVGALLSEKSIAEALRWGAANAASAVEEIGPQHGLLTRAKMARALKQHAKIIAVAM